MKIFSLIESLLNYGLKSGLFLIEDKRYVKNRLLDILELDDFDSSDLEIKDMELHYILEGMLDYAVDKNLLEEDSIVFRDIFDTKIMDALMPRPSEVVKEFRNKYENSYEEATNYFYKLSIASNYIRKDRIEKDLKWKTNTKYGDLDITINLSKPEKDPREIAKAKSMKDFGYPKCLLCVENEGYRGRINHPARNSHRLIPITLNNENWYLQYSPYVYYKEHCIVLNEKHTPMKIGKETFKRLIEFVDKFPHYFIGSNADLPIVGGSILSHDHFQGGRYEFPMANSSVKHRFTIPKFDKLEFQVLNWPMTAIRVIGKDMEKVVDGAFHIFLKWKDYSDEALEIVSFTDGIPHNTVTPIARMRENLYEMDIVLRNNRTSSNHPYGIFHPHEELHHIKKENIGLIEVMGLAVLPSRLKKELDDISMMLQKSISPREAEKNENVVKHIHFYEELFEKHKGKEINEIKDIINGEVGLIFLRVLEDAGVFKDNLEGKEGMERFIDSL